MKLVLIGILLTSCSYKIDDCLIHKESEFNSNPEIYKVTNVGEYNYVLNWYHNKKQINSWSYNKNSVHEYLYKVDCPKWIL